MTAVMQLTHVFSAKIVILLPDQTQPYSLTLHPSSTMTLSEKDTSVAAWVFDLRKPAGRFTDTLPMAEAYFIPLLTPSKTVGVLGVRTHRAEPLLIEQKALLETFASQIAGAIERMLLFASSPTTMNFLVKRRNCVMNIKKTLIFLFSIILLSPALGLAEVKKEYYPNGRLKAEWNYDNGKLGGISKVYYEGGKLQYEVHYKDGKQEGITKKYMKVEN